MRWRRIREIVRKEFRQLLREPRMRVVLFVPPIVQLIVFGYAVNLDVERTPIAWTDRDRTPESRLLREAFEGSPYFEITAAPASDRMVQELLDTGEVTAAVGVLPGFARRIQRGETAGVQILIEGTNSNTASIVSGYVNRVVAGYAAEVQQRQQRSRQMARAAGASGEPLGFRLPSLEVDSRIWFNPQLASRNYFVPGVIVNIITLVTLMLTALAVVREKEIGTMEQLMVTPIRPVELMLGKTLPFALVGFIEVIFVTTMALLVFRIPLLGNPVLLLFCAGLFLMTTLGAGLLISTISQTQQQAMMATFFFFLPAFMLSGFAFPIRNMPAAVQYLTYLNPLRYFMEIVRGIFLKGTGFAVLWPQMAGLVLFGIAVVTLSTLRFHKRLD